MVRPTLIFIPAQLVSSAFNSITSKITIQQESIGYNNIKHTFDKPFFQALIMTTAMSFSLVVRRFWDSNGKGHHRPTPFRLRLLLAVPALCDLITAILNIFGLVYINLSIYQMLRSSQIIFTAFFSVFILKKKIKGHEIFGISLVVISLIFIGWAGMFIPTNKDSELPEGADLKISIREKLLGSLLVTFGQVFISIQIILEEYLIQMKFKGQVGALEVIGNEGLMGLFITIILFPIAFVCPGTDPSIFKTGSLENLWDSLLMIYNKPTLLVFFLFSFIFGAIYNICAMCVITYTSSLTEAIVDAVSTLFVWILMLISYQIGLPFGEPWNKYSFLELAGFFLLVSGNLIYNGQLKLPCFKYPNKEELAEECLLDNSTQQSSMSYVQTLA